MKLQLSTVVICLTNILYLVPSLLCALSPLPGITSYWNLCLRGCFWGPQTKTRVFHCPSDPAGSRSSCAALSLSWTSFQPLGSISVSQIHSACPLSGPLPMLFSLPRVAFYPLSSSQHLMSTHFFLILIQCFIFKGRLTSLPRLVSTFVYFFNLHTIYYSL